jgi:hypothetical protein
MFISEIHIATGIQIEYHYLISNSDHSPIKRRFDIYADGA